MHHHACAIIHRRGESVIGDAVIGDAVIGHRYYCTVD
jgi:hypothetical protein